MKKSRKLLTLTAAIFALAAIMTSQTVMAATAPCTEITNQASLAYKVGNVPQTPVDSDNDSDDTNGINSTNFNVGVKVMLAVTSQDPANVGVVPSDTQTAVLTFKITNSGNAVHDYVLSRILAVDGTASHSATNDSFDLLVAPEDGASVIKYYLENGASASAGLQPSGVGADTEITAAITGGTVAIQDLNPATTYPLTTGSNETTAGTRTIYVEYLPSALTAAKDQVTVNYLKALTKWADSTDLAVTTTDDGNDSLSVTDAMVGGTVCGLAGNPTIDIVLGDADGDGGSATNNNDAARDGAHLDWGAFVVQNAVIDYTKTFTVISDGVNTSAPYKPIPGAVVEYTLEIKNTGNASAILGDITDNLDNNFLIDTANASWTVTGDSRATDNGSLTADDTDTDSDGLGHDDPSAVGGTVTAVMATILEEDIANGYAAGELKANETVTVKFRATIQ